MKAGPQLGIFWIYRRKVIASFVPADSIKAVGGSKDADLAHADCWAEVVKQHRELTGKEYWSVPRGRVVFQALKNAFIVFGSRVIVNDPSLIAKIIRRFNLSRVTVESRMDRHYDPPADDLFEDD